MEPQGPWLNVAEPGAPRSTRPLHWQAHSRQGEGEGGPTAPGRAAGGQCLLAERAELLLHVHVACCTGRPLPWRA